jgi:hypothetical protein
MENNKGVWDFHVSTEEQTVNLFETGEVCTHHQPNGLQVVESNYNFQFQQASVWRVTLGDDFKASAIPCQGLNDCNESG